VSERSRAQLLASRLQAARVEQGESEESPEDPRERDLRAQLTFLQSRLQDMELSRVERDSLRSLVGSVEEELALVQLRRAAGEDDDVLSPLSTGDLLAVLTAREHMLSYFVGEEATYLFSVTRRGVQVEDLGSTAVLDEKILRYLQLQRRSQASDDLPGAVMIQARGELYRLLVEPAAGDIAREAELIIAPDGLLHRLPFAYLHDGERYLVERNTLFVTPSLRVLGELRSRPYRRPGREGGGKVLAIAGEAGDTTRTHPYDEDQMSQLSDLPEAEGEVWQLARRFPAAEVLVGTAATEQRLRGGSLQEADIIHVAAHGYSDPVDFRKSYIMLSRESGVDGTGDDGLLQWQEIMNLNINPSLVTLASCRSAQGVFSRGEGVTGLTQAFLHAGTRGVLASLTDVPDRGTRWIMDRFYRELAQGKTAAQSLQTAQLAGLEWAREQGREAVLPGAAFVLIGDGDLRYAGAHRPWNLWLVVMGLLLVVGSVWMAAGAPRKLWHFPKKQV
jgi:CHAT domain-containing protein